MASIRFDESCSLIGQFEVGSSNIENVLTENRTRNLRGEIKASALTTAPPFLAGIICR